MKFGLQVIAILGCLLFLGCADSVESLVTDDTPDTLVRDGYDEEAMEKAIARATSEVDEFIKDLQSGRSQNYAVKVPIKDGEATEHFWLTDITYSEGQFTGIINNEPGMVSNVSIGQSWTVGKDGISDWMFMRDGKMHGNYTMRPLLETMPEAEAERFRALFAKP